MAKRAMVILANGFEEIEAISPIDILRRGGIEVVVAGVAGNDIIGSHGLKVLTETTVEQFSGSLDAVVLPGGSEGARNLARSEKVKSLVSGVHFEGGVIGAICAAPAVVLGPMGLLAGRNATCYPGMQSGFPMDAHYVEDPVVTDKNLVTANGPAAAVAFSLVLLEKIIDRQRADSVAGHLSGCPAEE